MTSISAIVQHATTVQQPSPNYRTDEDWAVIPSNIKANDIIDENARLSQRMPESSWLSRHEHFPLACAFALFTIISATVGILVICLTAPKSPKNICYPGTFTPTVQTIYTYDSTPRSVAIGDFNGDNLLDLVIANSGINNIGIRLAYDNGTFSSQMTYSTGKKSSPYWVVIGDFNNDHALDIAVANYGTNNIGVFLGYGNGTFANQLTFSLGPSRPLSLAVGDFNNDNKLDIVVANNGTFNITILAGSNDGTFQIESNYFMGYDSMPCSIAVADFNNDDRFDIAAVNYGTNELAIILSTKDGTYLINKYSTGTGSHPTSVTVDDFNHDHYIDIAIVNSATKNVGVFIGNGDGSFENLITYSTGSNSYPQFIVPGYIINNAKLDLIVADSGGNNVIVFKGDGNGNFELAISISTGYNSGPCALAVSDFDNDNESDIVVVNSGTNYIFVFSTYDYYVQANQTTYSIDGGSYPNSVAVGDFNDDKRPDIVVANTYSNNIGVFIASSNYAFNSQETFPVKEYNSAPYSIAVGDLNNDGQLDLAVAMISSGTVNIYFGQANGSFEYGPIYPVGDKYASPYSIAIADFNNDTNLDIVTANCDDDNLFVFLGNGNGTFRDGRTYPTGYDSCPIFVSADDFNSDGLLDLASANYDSPTISIFLGNGNGTFQNSVNISTENYSSWLAIGDLNNDQHRDIVFTAPDSSVIGILLGYGDGNFANVHTYSTGIGAVPWSVVLADFHGDAILDMAVVYEADSSVGIFVGNGKGNFTAQDPIFLQDVSYAQSMATGDFNNDGRTDIVVGNIGSNDITILLVRYLPGFGNQTAYPQGSDLRPSSVTAADFNKDGQMDIVVANSGNDTVQILIDYNNETFMNNITYSTGIGSHPQYVVTADLNNDNQLDMAVVNTWTATLMVFLNSGNGTFSTSSAYSTGSQSFPNSIGLGDFNKDGWIDIVVANNNTNNVGVFLGFDYPTFATRNLNVPQRGSSPYYVVVGDFNKDSRCDIAVAYQQVDSIGVFLSNGNGKFSDQLLYSESDFAAPVSLTIGDFNNDNQSDIAVANSGTNNITIFLGVGNGSFTQYASYSTGSTSPVSIAAGDFNSDTKQDLVVANKDGGNVGVFLGYGNGSFTEQISYLMPNGSSPVGIVVSHFNEDDILDIAVANYDGNNIGILLGYGNGTFRNVILYSTGIDSYPVSIAIGDFNKDNCMDIVVANQAVQNVGIFFGYCDGTFSLQATYSTGSTSSLTSITVRDLNNDTILDIAVSDWGSGNGNIGVLYGLNDGTFLVPKPYLTGFNSQPTSIAICDFNNDGHLDFAVSNSKTNNIGIMLRDKTEPFGIQTPFSTGTGSSPYSVAVTDFNNDNQLDIAVANFKTNNIGIFIGYGNGSFAEQKIYSTGNNSAPMYIAIGDFNDDKQSDIVVANFNANNIGIFLGDGQGTFGIMQNYSTGQNSGPASVAVADLNKDNHTDIVVTDAGVNLVLVFFGFGNGTFSNPDIYFFPYDSRPISVAIEDLNNDGSLDMSVANYGLGYVEFLLQTC